MKKIGNILYTKELVNHKKVDFVNYYNDVLINNINNNLPIDKINKVSNLVWVCNDCYNAIHTGLIPVNTETKTINKILKYQAKLNAKSVSSN